MFASRALSASLILTLSGCLAYSTGDDDAAGDDDVSGDDDTASDDDTSGDDDTSAVDADGDGWFPPDDCDDEAASTYPGAEELCNGLDDDCDGAPDDDLPALTFYRDGDGDGYGSSFGGTTLDVCAAPPGYSEIAGDCADSVPTINPAATEACNGADDNCDGSIDEGVQTTLWVDWDNDGFGAGAPQGLGCPGEGYADNGLDCDDWNPVAQPLDQDGDGWTGCDGDCNDQDAQVYPGIDLDGDGADLCVDCDDSDPGLSPYVGEVCNGADENCNGLADDGIHSVMVVYGSNAQAAQGVVSALSPWGYCVLTQQVGQLGSVPLGGYPLIVLTHDTGDASGFFGDIQPVQDAYWGWGNKVLGLGTGGFSGLVAINATPVFQWGTQVPLTGGIGYVADASDPVWTSAVAVLPSLYPYAPLTAYSQGGASIWALSASAGASRGVLYASASGGDHTVAIDDSSWPGMRYWGWNLGLQQATVDGRELFVNLVADAIGQP